MYRIGVVMEYRVGSFSRYRVSDISGAKWVTSVDEVGWL